MQRIAQNSSVSKLNEVVRKVYQHKKMEKKQQLVGKEVPKPDLSQTPASINFMVVGNGGFATPRSVYIQTSHNNYLINCSENTQRLTTILGWAVCVK